MADCIDKNCVNKTALSFSSVEISGHKELASDSTFNLNSSVLVRNMLFKLRGMGEGVLGIWCNI